MGNKVGRLSLKRSPSGRVSEFSQWACECGNTLDADANFCCRCGRRALRFAQFGPEAEVVKTNKRQDQISTMSTESSHGSEGSASDYFDCISSDHASDSGSACSSAAWPAALELPGLARESSGPSKSSSFTSVWSHTSKTSKTSSVPSAYRGWKKSKSYDAAHMLQSILPEISEACRKKRKSSRFAQSSNSNSSQQDPESPHGTPSLSRRPSVEGELMFQSSDSAGDCSQSLTHALKHSGSFMLHTVRMRVLLLPSSLTTAHGAAQKPDLQMPLFDAKIDFENLLNVMPPSPLKPCLISMQRVSFMGTEWLGIRLDRHTHAKCLQFCICVAALLNVGKSTSRTVVVEACGNDSRHCPGFACAPISDRSLENIPMFFDYAKDISELAAIISNEPGLPQKRVAADLKRWCRRSNQIRGGEARKKSPRFSLKRFVDALETQLTSLSPADCLESPRAKRSPRDTPKRGPSFSRTDSDAASSGQERRGSFTESNRRRSRRKSCPELGGIRLPKRFHSDPGFTGINQIEEESDDLQANDDIKFSPKSASYSPKSGMPTLEEYPDDPLGLKVIVYEPEEVHEIIYEPERGTVEDDDDEMRARVGNVSLERRRYSTGNMQCERRRSGKIFQLRRSSSSTLD